MKKNVMKTMILVSTLFFFFHDAMSQKKDMKSVSSIVNEYVAFLDKAIMEKTVDTYLSVETLSTLANEINCQLTKKQSEILGMVNFPSLRFRSCGSASFPEKATLTETDMAKYKACIKKLLNYQKTKNSPTKTQNSSKKMPIKSKQIVIEIPSDENGMSGIAIALNSNLKPSTWEDAKMKCDTLRFGRSQAGNVFDDWKLPNKEELCIIYNYYKKHPEYFKAGAEYWSSEQSGRRAGFYFSAKFWTMDLPCQPTHNDGKTNFEIMPIRVYNNIQDGQ
jgi:hypothetical protein